MSVLRDCQDISQISPYRATYFPPALGQGKVVTRVDTTAWPGWTDVGDTPCLDLHSNLLLVQNLHALTSAVSRARSAALGKEFAVCSRCFFVFFFKGLIKQTDLKLGSCQISAVHYEIIRVFPVTKDGDHKPGKLPAAWTPLAAIQASILVVRVSEMSWAKLSRGCWKRLSWLEEEPVPMYTRALCAHEHSRKPPVQLWRKPWGQMPNLGWHGMGERLGLSLESSHHYVVSWKIIA